MTPEGRRFILFTVAVGVAAINTGNNLFYLLLAMMLSLIIMSGFLSELCLRKLELYRYAPTFLYAGEPGVLTVTISNRKSRLPSFSLRLYDVVEGSEFDRGMHLRQLPPQTSQMLSCALSLPRRGLYRIEGMILATPFPFGLFVKRAYVPCETTITVLPQPTLISRTLIPEMPTAGTQTRLVKKGLGLDLYNLRVYQPGDDSRRIHWMSTARTAQLIVRETETETQDMATIYLSLLTPAQAHDRFEPAVALAASVVAHLHEQGYRVRLVVGATTVQSDTVGEDLRHILAPLATCLPEEPPVGIERLTAEVHPDIDDRSLMIAILPWSTPDLLRSYGQATRLIDLGSPEHGVLLHGRDQRLPA
ncbi:MAG: DUF58 domain-containing protein [Nitrospiraceae bacterium]